MNSISVSGWLAAIEPWLVPVALLLALVGIVQGWRATRQVKAMRATATSVRPMVSAETFAALQRERDQIDTDRTAAHVEADQLKTQLETAASALASANAELKRLRGHAEALALPALLETLSDQQPPAPTVPVFVAYLRPRASRFYSNEREGIQDLRRRLLQCARAIRALVERREPTATVRSALSGAADLVVIVALRGFESPLGQEHWQTLALELHKEAEVSLFRCSIGYTLEGTQPGSNYGYHDLVVQAEVACRQQLGAVQFLRHASERWQRRSEAPEIDPKLYNEVRLAVDAGNKTGNRFAEFKIVFQPRYRADRLNGGLILRICGAEALIRFGSQPSPQHALAFLADDDLMMDFNEHKLLPACVDLISRLHARDKARYRRFRVSFNVRPQDLTPVNAGRLAELIERSNLTTDQFEAEILESGELPKDIAQGIAELQRAGLWIAHDDFGDRAANLRQLLTLNATTLKFDRLIVEDVLKKNVQGESFITNLVNAIKHVKPDMHFVAEGIGKRRQDGGCAIATMVRCGVTEFQGYALAMPMPLDSLLELVDQPGQSELSVPLAE